MAAETVHEQLDAVDTTGSPGEVADDLPAASDEEIARAVARERERVAGDLRAVVVEHLHRLVDEARDGAESSDRRAGWAAVGQHARVALGAVTRAAALGGVDLRVPAAPTAVGRTTRGAGVVVGTVLAAVLLSVAALLVVALPGDLAVGPLLVVGLAIALALVARFAPLPAAVVVLAAPLVALVLDAPLAATVEPVRDAVVAATAWPLLPAPSAGGCLLLGIVLAAAWGAGRQRRRAATAAARGRWLRAVDDADRAGAQGRLGLPDALHHTLVRELTVLAELPGSRAVAPGPAEGTATRRARVARHRLAGALPALVAVDLAPHGDGRRTDTSALLDEGRVAVLVATARHAAQLAGHGGARQGGRPPSVVVRGEPAGGDRPEVGRLASRLLAELVGDVASRPGPVPACVTVEHRGDAVALEVAAGRGRWPGARPGRVPVALAERAALLDGTAEVTATPGTLSVRVELPTRAAETTATPVADPATAPVATRRHIAVA